MSNINPKDFTDAAALDGAELLPVHQTLGWRKTTLTAIKTWLAGYFAAKLGADDNYVTAAEKNVLANTSGTNSGDSAGHGELQTSLGLGNALQTLRTNAGATALEWSDPPTGGGRTVQALGTKDTNYTIDFNSGLFATVTTGSGVATLTIPDWGSATVSVDAWLYITQGATARVQTLGTASGTNNNIASSGGLASAGDALGNSGANAVDAFCFTWTGTKWFVSNAIFDIKA